MIAIQKCPAPPGLVRAGEEHARELCAAYDAAPELYLSGKQKMEVRKGIYKSVRAELNACHRGKCCYCEVRFDDRKPQAYPEVEHWRPQSNYYWLAYSWDNLLLSCSFCNRTKGDQFPLADPAMRATYHGMRIDDETPEILKPDGDEELRKHIKFVGDRPEGRTPHGHRTVEVLELDSPIHAGRRDYLAELAKKRKLCIDLMGVDDARVRPHVEDARKEVEAAVQPDKPFSAMAAAFLAANPLPDPSAQKVMGAGGSVPDLGG